VPPALEACMVELRKQGESGQITSEEASWRRDAEYKRPYAPFTTRWRRCGPHSRKLGGV
jgi:hypothetical protein